MTVESLEVAKKLVEEEPRIFSVWEYRHAITGKKLWSASFGVGLEIVVSEYVADPRLIYWAGEWKP